MSQHYYWCTIYSTVFIVYTKLYLRCFADSCYFNTKCNQQINPDVLSYTKLPSSINISSTFNSYSTEVMLTHKCISPLSDICRIYLEWECKMLLADLNQIFVVFSFAMNQNMHFLYGTINQTYQGLHSSIQQSFLFDHVLHLFCNNLCTLPSLAKRANRYKVLTNYEKHT